MQVLYRDEHLVAVDKPPGMLVHRSKIDHGESRFALQTVRDQLGRRVYPVHRLDKAASGLLLFALSPETAGRLAEAFAQGGVTKTYLALTRGHTPEHGVIDHALRERLDPIGDASARRDKPARAAITAFRRLATAELPFAVGRYPTARYSLLVLQPRTGRRHQIRRHLKHISHPIVGDSTHGDSRHNAFFREHFGCARLLLAAIRLSFTHPHAGTELTIDAPADEAFAGVVTALGWEQALRDERKRTPPPASRLDLPPSVG